MTRLPALAEGCRLTASQTLLARAATRSGEAGRAAWRAWREHADLEHLDQDSESLLPALYRSLPALAIADPWSDRLKGIWRHTWSRNHLLVQWVGALLADLTTRGIDTMVLGGVALVTRHHRDLGSRRVDDVHVMVRPAQVARAADVLRARGWCATAPVTDDLVRYRHAMAFLGADRRALELSWHVVPECSRPDADDDFWRRAVPLTVATADTVTLSAADQLVRVCVNGVRREGTQPCRWVADALAILTTAGADLDGSRVTEIARVHRLSVPLAVALAYLHAELGAPVPAPLLPALRRIATSRRERMEYESKARARQTPLLGSLPALWFHYRRLGGDPGMSGGVVGFFDYLRHVWALERRWQVPLRAAAKGLRRCAMARPWSA